VRLQARVMGASPLSLLWLMSTVPYRGAEEAIVRVLAQHAGVLGQRARGQRERDGSARDVCARRCPDSAAVCCAQCPLTLQLQCLRSGCSSARCSPKKSISSPSASPTFSSIRWVSQAQVEPCRGMHVAAVVRAFPCDNMPRACMHDLHFRQLDVCSLLSAPKAPPCRCVMHAALGALAALIDALMPPATLAMGGRS
jgi:hypothetical protein